MGISRLCVYLASLSFSMSLAFFLSTGARLSAPAYTAIIQAPGGPRMWGTLFMFAGLLITAGLAHSSRTLLQLQWSVSIASVPYLLLMTAFLVAALRFDTANITAPVAYGFIFLFHVGLSRAIYRRRKKEF